MSIRKAIESMYQDTCTVIEHQSYTKANKTQGFHEVPVLEGQPCKLSYKAIETTAQTEEGAALRQQAKLFVTPDVEIKPGCKIIVTRNGKEYFFQRSGEPGTFTNHQEIILDLWKGWA